MKIKTLKSHDPLDELVLAALKGDQAAWEQVFKSLDRKLVAYLSARGNREDAHDAAQSAWSKAWQKASTFDPGDSPKANFTGFLFRIGTNELISMQRRKRAQALGDEFDTAGNSSSGEENAMLREELAIMKDCIQALPEDQQKIMIMRMTMSDGQVIEALQIAKGTAASRYNRARDAVRACIERKLSGGKPR